MVIAWLFIGVDLLRVLGTRRGIAVVIVTAISTIFLYAAYGDPDLPGHRRPRMEEGTRLEPRPLVQAGRDHRADLDHRPDVPVLVPDVGQHLVAVHGRDRAVPARLLLRVGPQALPGPQGPGRASRSSPRSSGSSRQARRAGGASLDRRVLRPSGPAGAGRPAPPAPEDHGEARDHERDARQARPARGAEARSATGSIDTLVVALTDMQGRLMGKRVQGQAFLDGVIDHGAHFCTYLLGTDMEMNTPDGLRADELGDRLRRLDRRLRSGTRCGSCPGWRRRRSSSRTPSTRTTHTEIPVSPRTMLKRRSSSAAEHGLPGQGRLGVRVLPADRYLRDRPAQGLRRPGALRLPTTRTITCSRRPRREPMHGCCAI